MMMLPKPARRPCPAETTTFTAGQFELTIDGHSARPLRDSVGRVAPGAPPRGYQVHELPQLWQHAGEFQPGKVAQTDHHFDVPSTRMQPGRLAPSTIILRRGIGRGASYWRTRSVAASLWSGSVPPAGRSFTIGSTAPGRQDHRADLHAKGGGDVAIEEIVSAMRVAWSRVPAAGSAWFTNREQIH